MKKLKYIFTITLFVCFACSETEDNSFNLCNDCVVIDNDLYKNTATNNYTITDIQLNEDLLTIKISASGCDGNSWAATLIDANEIAESNPIQRFIKLSLENKEFCLAVFEKEFTFNIKKLKENQSKIILNLEGWNKQIEYN